jgi:hypothetical protein
MGYSDSTAAAENVAWNNVRVVCRTAANGRVGQSQLLSMGYGGALFLESPGTDNFKICP